MYNGHLFFMSFTGSFSNNVLENKVILITDIEFKLNVSRETPLEALLDKFHVEHKVYQKNNGLLTG